MEKKNLSAYRKSYERGELLETEIPNNPIQLFDSWFKIADDHPEIAEPNAMNLATCGSDSQPRNRIVLLKSFDKTGFVFFSNYESEKGKDLMANSSCCLSFFWPALEKQVIIEGAAERVSEKESSTYFHSRPKGSQLGALASNQSSVIESREQLEEKISDLEKKYEDKEIPKPDYWGGYLVKPKMIEFWQGRANRLHDRIRYSLTENDWKINRLAP